MSAVSWMCERLRKHYPVVHPPLAPPPGHPGQVRAVDDVSFTVRAGRDAGPGG